jgi:uncharacterized protein
MSIGEMTAARPFAISQYVLKVHSRCDLACDHCYVYEHADQSWQAKPRTIALSTVDRAAQRIAEHAASHRLPGVQVILHGGEPLLLGQARMREVLATLVERVSPVTQLDIRIQTNGVRLDERWCELFGEYRVKVGVSLDGDRTANDRHRRYSDDRSSYEQVRRALAILRRPEFRDLYAGILCTIDIANDPIAVYRALVAEEPPRADLLLPHATWDLPPARPSGMQHPYADWLLSIYRCWIRDGRPMPIRLFDSVLSVASGGPSYTEALGLNPAGMLVVDTDGGWEQADSLKTAFDGAPRTGMGVQSHTVDSAACYPGMVASRRGLTALCATCRACPVVAICGGGMYAHRYHGETGFANPSVYCADLFELISKLVKRTAEVTVTGKDLADHVPDRLPEHQLPEGAFDALASGPGTPEAVSALAQMRLSKTRALVAAVAGDDGRAARHDMELTEAAAAGWTVLCELDSTHPDGVAEVFAHPYTRIWAMRCLRPPVGAQPLLDRAHLAGLAAAAALRAGISTDLAVPVRDGLLHLPSVGALAVGDLPERTVMVSVSPGRVAVRVPSAWQTVRQVAGTSLQFAVEDLDPFRDCQRWPATGRLTQHEWFVWHKALASACRGLVVGVPRYAEVLTAGLRAVVPLLPAPAGMRSATSRHAFGAIAITLPADSSGIEELLVHEFQHVKLFALSDLYQLVDPNDTHLLRVPWREDPRPVEGVLHGTYAYLALAQLSRSRGMVGQATWLRYRTWVSGACHELRAVKALTSDGERFVDCVLAALDGVETAT